MIPHPYPAALPRAITDPSGGTFLFASFIGTMIIVGALVLLTFRTVHDPSHRSPVLSDEGEDNDTDPTPIRD